MRQSLAALSALLVSFSANAGDINIDMNKTPCAAWNAVQWMEANKTDKYTITVTKLDATKAGNNRAASCGNQTAKLAYDQGKKDGNFKSAPNKYAASCDEFPPASTSLGGDAAYVMVMTQQENSMAGAGINQITIGAQFTIEVLNWDIDTFQKLVPQMSGDWGKTDYSQPLGPEDHAIRWCYSEPKVRGV